MPIWVQHISGQGEKWELADVIWNDRHSNKTWVTTTPSGASGAIELPRSEYHIVAHAERWETCTREVVTIEAAGSFHWKSFKMPSLSLASLSLRWAWSEKDPDALIIQRDALIIQRKVQP